MPRFFGAIHEGLWESLLSKQLLKDAAYVKLVRPEDGEEYAPFNFTGVHACWVCGCVSLCVHAC